MAGSHIQEPAVVYIGIRQFGLFHHNLYTLFAHLNDSDTT